MRRFPQSQERHLKFETLEDRRLLAITVDTFVDEADGSIVDGDVSLRDALALAATDATIDFDLALDGETILLTLGELVITDSVNIDASTVAVNLTIDASGNDPTPAENNGDGSRVFNINDGNNGTNIDVLISGLKLTGGDVSGSGGGVYNTENLTIVDSTISGNSANSGGGIENDGVIGLLTGSTVSGNTALTGGGITNGGFLQVDTSTISGNSGGGIFNSSLAELEIFGTTISDNQTTSAAGVNNVGTALLLNTIIAGNIGTVDNTDVFGDFNSQGYNLIGSIGAGVSGFTAQDFVGTESSPIDPKLAPLADNGGTTLTHALLPGSAAIDTGDTGDLGDTFVADLSGNSNDASVVGEVTFVSGVLGESANFPAGGGGVPENYVSLDVENIAPSQIPTEAITIATWARLTQTGLRHPIFTSHNASNQVVMHAVVNPDGKTVFTLQDDNGDTIVRLTAGNIPFNQWFHYAVTFDKVGHEINLYINGTLVTSAQGPADSNLFIGSDWDTGARIGSMTIDPATHFRGQLTGQMDEFYLFTRALSSSEITTLATVAGAPMATPLVTGDLSIYYPFDIISSEVVTDQRKGLRVLNGDGINGATIDMGSFERVNDFNPDDPIPEEIQTGPITVHLSPIATGLVSPSLVVSAGDDSGRIFVSDQIGLVHLIKNGVLRVTPFLDITNKVKATLSGNDERGLSGFVFHPDFSNVGMEGYGKFYTWTDELVDDLEVVDFTHFPLAPGVTRAAQSVLREWTMNNITDEVFSGTSREMLRIDQPHLAHCAGNAAFGPDGYLYLSLGDGGTHDDQGPGHNPDIGNSRDLTNIYGSMLRIDPFGTNSTNGKYGIPASNPFVGDPLALDEIFFYGLRNPFRFSFERDAAGNKTTKIIIGDTGQDDIEEVDRADINLDAGGHFGWNLKEGTFIFDPGPPPSPGGELRIGITADSPGSPLGLIDPIVQYDHGVNGEGSAVIGGYVYQGDLIPELKGKYIFGDFTDFTSPSVPSGRIFYSDFNDADPEILELNLEGVLLTANGGVSIFIKGFGIDDTGEIYVLGSTTLQSTDNSGVILKLTPTSPQVLVAPTTGLETTEDGGTAEFSIVLSTQPTDNVTIDVESDNTNEGTVSTSSVMFTTNNWNTAQTVIATGVSDDDQDGPIMYHAVIGPVTSSDPEYQILDPDDILITNLDTTSPGLSGDFDGDGDADGFDFLSWQQGFGTTSGAIRSDGDSDEDGDVDDIDLAAWESQLGMTAAVVEAASVPATQSLLVVQAKITPTIQTTRPIAPADLIDAAFTMNQLRITNNEDESMAAEAQLSRERFFEILFTPDDQRLRSNFLSFLTSSISIPNEAEESAIREHDEDVFDTVFERAFG